MPDTISLFGATVALDVQLLFLFAVVYIAGIIRGFAGFGSALLVVPALAMIYGPAEAVVIEVMIEIPISLGLLPVALREAERKTVLPLLAMFVLFVPVGALMLKAVDPEPMKIVISVSVLIMVVVIFFQNSLTWFSSRVGMLVTGMLSGFSQGLTGMAGPLFAAALLARGESATLTRANLVAVAGGLIGITVVSFVLVGLVTVETLVYAALATPMIMLGVWTGAYIFRRFAHLNLRGVILGFLALTAVVSLFSALN
jgi:uncharacterized membrane protein YfcA